MILDILLVAHGLGLWFLIATLLLFLSVYLEQMAAAHKPDETDREKVDFGGFALMATTTLTPALLLLYAFLSTLGMEARIRVIAAGMPITALILASLIGRLVGVGWKSGGRIAKALVLPVSLVAFVATIYATWWAIVAVGELLQGRAIVSRGVWMLDAPR